MSSERVFIIGGTGNIGTKCVKDLLDNNIPVTLFARNPDKVYSLFSNNDNLVRVIQGDFNDLSPIQEGIKGHTRLFLLVSDFSKFVKIKETIAKYAYDAGVKQVVDISSYTVNMGWRTNAIGSIHYQAEKAIFDIPERGYFVALRPARFMSVQLQMDAPIKNGAIYDTLAPESVYGWISPEDIGSVAAVILREDVHKHGDYVYSLTGDVISSSQRAEILSRVLDKEIKYQVISAPTKYKNLMAFGHFSHTMVMQFCSGLTSETDTQVTPAIEILLDRKPETFEEYITKRKSSFR